MSISDFSLYVAPTRFSAADGIVLGMQLITAAEGIDAPRPRKSLGVVRDEVVKLQAVTRGRLRPSGSALRGIASRLGGGYVGGRMRLDGLIRISSGETQARAASLRVRLLPQGTKFVTGEFTELYTTSDNLLHRIAEQGLEAEIDELVGPTFLPFIRAQHAAFGEALGVGGTVIDAPDSRAVATQISALAEAIAAYGRAMVGWVETDDEESVAAFQRAMGPLDRHRRGLTNGGRDDEPEAPGVEDDPDAPNPEDPVPPMPGDDDPDVTDDPAPLEA
ncbi:MAG: hypothetical protein VYE22_05315 [Myxococcota bacterium]|nr:hypothetical protein [Myxococcota bacterium]